MTAGAREGLERRKASGHEPANRPIIRWINLECLDSKSSRGGQEGCEPLLPQLHLKALQDIVEIKSLLSINHTALVNGTSKIKTGFKIRYLLSHQRVVFLWYENSQVGDQ